MALLPTIPTSFVPRTNSTAAKQRMTADFGGALSILSYALFVIVVLFGIGLFFYGRILAGTLTTKNAEVAKAEAAIDPATVQSFVRLRNRLNAGRSLLGNHTAPSTFFTALESILPSSVRFTSLHLSIDSTGTGKVDGSGTSKSFNALSAASTAFANDGRMKDVIFSKMTINSKDNSVSFGFAALLDPKLLTFSPENSGGVQDLSSL